MNFWRFSEQPQKYIAKFSNPNFLFLFNTKNLQWNSFLELCLHHFATGYHHIRTETSEQKMKVLPNGGGATEGASLFTQEITAMDIKVVSPDPKGGIKC